MVNCTLVVLSTVSCDPPGRALSRTSSLILVTMAAAAERRQRNGIRNLFSQKQIPQRSLMLNWMKCQMKECNGVQCQLPCVLCK